MAKRGLFQSDQSYRLAVPVLAFIYMVMQIPAAKEMLALGKGLTTDDAMRLVEVRDLLAGQAWYDLFQHRVLPPDGLSMHWSRYIDAPMAAFMWLLKPFVGLDMAGRLLAIVWPLALGLAMILMTASLTRRLFGGQAAFLAVLCIICYEMLSGSGFGVGGTDHHGVQILLMLGLARMIILPERPLQRGLIGGALAALSLAVGLEMIFFIALSGIILVVSHILDRDSAADRLLGFASGLAVAAPVLMAGQLAPALWQVTVCDALSPPLLAVTTAAFVASTALVLAGRRVKSPMARAAVTGAVGAIVALALLPVVQPCLAGPYTAMSEEIQRTVLAQIQEIKPAAFYFTTEGGRAIALFLPFYATTLVFAASVLTKRGDGLSLLPFAILAAVLSFWQVRMMNMGLPVIAVLFGAAGAWAMNHPRRAIRFGGVAFVIAVLLSKPLAVLYVKADFSGNGAAKAEAKLGNRCSNIDQMAKLDQVPPAILFNPINFGPLILLASRHSVTSAPYHRSADAFVNGILPFAGDEAALRAAIKRTKADYIVLCKDDSHGTKDSIGSQLAKGQTRPWLTEVPLGTSNLRLLKVTE